MEAEVVYSSDPYQGAVQPADAMDDLLGPLGPYADPIATGGYSAPLTPPPPPRHKKKKKQGSSPGTDAIARFVLFGMLPCAAVFVLLGFLGVFRGLVLFPLMAKDFARQAQRPTSNEPGPSGQAITIWDAKESAGGVFSVEYRVDGGTLEPAGSYFWIINGPVGKVEFPIPGATWAKQRQQLSGRAPAANGTDLNGRLTCYIEEQAGTTRRRISNEVTVRH